RAQIEDRVRRHGLGIGGGGEVTKGPAIDESAVVADQKHGAGSASAGNGVLHDLVEHGETGLIAGRRSRRLCDRCLRRSWALASGLLRDHGCAAEEDEGKFRQREGWPAQTQAQDDLSLDELCPTVRSRTLSHEGAVCRPAAEVTVVSLGGERARLQPCRKGDDEIGL